jgi:outer membrane protein TolC
MNKGEAAFAGQFPVTAQPQAETDALIRGLERKLDVLRAQLSACRAGEDDGAAGVATWSRLEAQSQHILQLEQELERARAEIQNCQRANILLGRALEAIPAPAPPPAFPEPEPEPEPEQEPEPLPPTVPLAEALMLQAMLKAMRNSTSWRITAPVRAAGYLLKRLRGTRRR